MSFLNPEIITLAENAIISALDEGRDDAETVLPRHVIYKIGSDAIAKRPKNIQFLCEIEVRGSAYEVFAR